MRATQRCGLLRQSFGAGLSSINAFGAFARSRQLKTPRHLGRGFSNKKGMVRSVNA
ncbi:MAG: hypothetical protein V4481_03285 [Patescibacteria group bacterium]